MCFRDEAERSASRRSASGGSGEWQRRGGRDTRRCRAAVRQRRAGRVHRTASGSGFMSHQAEITEDWTASGSGFMSHRAEITED
eukprot:gene9696-6939_t